MSNAKYSTTSDYPKHTGFKIQFCTGHAYKKAVLLKHVPAAEALADVFSKLLSKQKSVAFLKQIGMKI